MLNNNIPNIIRATVMYTHLKVKLYDLNSVFFRLLKTSRSWSDVSSASSCLRKVKFEVYTLLSKSGDKLGENETGVLCV